MLTFFNSINIINVPKITAKNLVDIMKEPIAKKLISMNNDAVIKETKTCESLIDNSVFFENSLINIFLLILEINSVFIIDKF